MKSDPALPADLNAHAELALRPRHEAAVKRAQAYQDEKSAYEVAKLAAYYKHAAADIPQFARASSDGFYQAEFAELEQRARKARPTRYLELRDDTLKPYTADEENDFPEPEEAIPADLEARAKSSVDRGSNFAGAPGHESI